MNKMAKIFIITLILFGIALILFITGKRYDVFIENNSTAPIKYSINGEPYKVLEVKKKIQAFSKGLNNVVYLKTVDEKVIEKELPSKNINIFINEAINNSEKWYEIVEK